VSTFPIHPDKNTICDVIMHWAGTQPDAPALIDPDVGTVSYGNLVKEMTVLRQSIFENGFGREDRIGIIHPGGVELAIRMLGVMSGFTAVPLNPAFTETEFRDHLQGRGVTALMADPGTADGAIAAAQSLGIPNLEGFDAGNRESVALEPIAEEKPDNDSCPLSSPEDIAIIWGTSATTAQSKIVPSRHKRLLVRASVEESVYGVGPDDVGIVFRPLHYSGPFHNVACTLYSGSAIVVLPKFEPAEFFRCLTANAVTWYSGGPTFHRAIHAYVTANPHVTEGLRLRFIRVGSAALEPEIFEDLERMFGVPVETNYNSGESGRIANSLHGTAPRKKGSVGVPVERLGVANAAVRIRSLDGQFLPAGARGEVVVRGGQVFEGYENAPELNSEIFVDGWFRTGDEGFLDEDGYLTLTGRIKEMINRGGEKVSPAEVDAALLSHPDVREAATFPLRHPTLGEEVAAAVVQAPGAALTDQILTRYLVDRLTGFKVPRRFYFVDEIPKSDAGKLQRYKLAEALGVSADIGTHGAGVSDREATPLEAQLQVIWARALGIPEVGVDDNFLMLGGDSLQAVELFLRIEKVLGRRLPRAVLFEAGTVAEMAQRIEDLTPSPCLVPIQPKGDGLPFFCVHDGNGQVLNYRDLARLVGEAQPFYGIQCRGLDDKDEIPFTRIEDMAAYYIGEIKKVQPAGPYFLGGYSFGGRVAYVMAQQLRAAGEEVALLALLDTASGYGQRHVTTRDWLAHHRERMRSLGVSQIPAYLWLRTANLAGIIYMGTRIRCFALAWRILESRNWPVPRFMRRPVPANDMIRRTYQAKSYDGDATLFKAERYAWNHADAHDGWRDLIKGKLEIRPIPGRHYEIVKQPHVQALAVELADALDQARAAHWSPAGFPKKAS
jgi:acyl-CoA synthetase (AMP-forming)/AMP-acid ligase II/thioesterase domain-containing protein/acyl carrier protein